MRLALLGYCIGITVVAFFPVLDIYLFVTTICLLLALLICSFFSKSRFSIAFVSALILGACWHWIWAVDRRDAQIPASVEGKDVLVEGWVSSIPASNDRGQQFDFLITHAEPFALQGYVKLSTFFQEDAELFEAGSRWRLLLRLKQVHGYANPGIKNREASLFSENIIATGYVRACQCNELLGLKTFSFVRLRASFLNHLRDRLGRLDINPSASAVVPALVFGERSQLSSTDWQRYSRTGTTHLFIISGLHIGLVSLLFFKLTNFLMRFGPSQLTHIPSPVLAAVFSMVGALVYSLLAGWTLPVQRAFAMCCAFLLSYLIKQQLSMSLRFLAALTVVLTLDPLALVSSGFWLSFTAVAVILGFVIPAGEAIREPDVRSGFNVIWNRYVRTQWIVYIGLFLPLVFWVGEVSVLAPVVNVIAIPLVGLFLVPLLLASVALLWLSTSMADSLLLIAVQVIFVLNTSLDWMAGSYVLQPDWMPNTFELSHLLFLVSAMALLMMPWKTPFRWLAFPLLTPLVFVEKSSLTEGEYQVHVLDVGQGLAAIVQTKAHVLLYDTGPGITGSWNAGDAIVLPTLRRLNIDAIDALVVSHGDSDHAGGLPAILDNIPVEAIFSGEPLDQTHTVLCHRGLGWTWEGIQFQFLHPHSVSHNSNNNSCVLLISNGVEKTLFMGDVDTSVERDLVTEWGDGLCSDLMIAGHHGSKTSSSYALLKATEVKHVVFAAGYKNGFGHPAPEIVTRHAEFGSQIHNTAIEGMLSFSFGGTGLRSEAGRFRRDHRRYWAWSGLSLPCRYC